MSFHRQPPLPTRATSGLRMPFPSNLHFPVIRCCGKAWGLYPGGLGPVHQPPGTVEIGWDKGTNGFGSLSPEDVVLSVKFRIVQSSLFATQGAD